MSKDSKLLLCDGGGFALEDLNKRLFNRIAQEYGMLPGPVRQIGDQVYRQYDILPLAPGEHWQDQEQRFWSDFRDRFDKLTNVPLEDLVELSKECMQIIEPVFPVLDMLRPEVVSGICSNNTEFFWRRHVEKFPILGQYFADERVTLSARVGVRKNSPTFRMFYAGVEDLGFTKEDSLFVDDSEDNAAYARRYGIDAVVCSANNPDSLREFEQGLRSRNYI